VRYFLYAGTLGFFGIGMGPDKAEKGEFGSLVGASDFATSEGEGNTLAADKFWKSILSGDPTEMAKVLGPEFSAINKQGQQQIKTSSEFGNRGGGTNAGNQMVGDKTRSSVTELESSLVGKAGEALGASGSSLLSAGMSGHQAAFSEADTLHQQRSAQINDIFKSISDIATSFIPGAGIAKTAASAAGGFSADATSFGS